LLPPGPGPAARVGFGGMGAGVHPVRVREIRPNPGFLYRPGSPRTLMTVEACRGMPISLALPT